MGASAGYLREAAKASRQPRCVLAIESVDAIIEEITSLTDWQGYGSKTNVSLSDPVGSIVPDYRSSSWVDYGTASGFPDDNTKAYSAQIRVQAPAYDLYARRAVLAVGLSFEADVTYNDILCDITVNFRTTSGGSAVHTVDYDGYELALNTNQNYRAQLNIDTELPLSVELTASSYLYCDVVVSYAKGKGISEGIWSYPASAGSYLDESLKFLGGLLIAVPESATNCTLTTGVVDLGLTPSNTSEFFIDYSATGGASVTVTAYADDVDGSTSRGTVTDGDAIGAAGYRYYKFKLDFATTDGNRAQVDAISVVGGDAAYDYLGTHDDIPGVQAVLPDEAIGLISTKLDPKKGLATVGEVSAKVNWTAETSNMVASGQLRNKRVKVLSGFAGLGLAEYYPCFVGSFHDWAADQNARLFTFKFRDALRKFDKVKIPSEEWSAGSKTSTSFGGSSQNICSYIIDVVDAIPLPDRFFDQASLDDIETNDLTGTDYDISRTIGDANTDPEEAMKLLEELAQLSGIFLGVRSDGKFTGKLFDADETASVTLDATSIDFGGLKGNQADLYTKHLWYYDASTGVYDPGSEGDFDKASMVVDATAETAWDESNQRERFDKWGAGANLIDEAVARLNSWEAWPRLTTQANNLPPVHVDIEFADVIGVDNLLLPAPTAAWSSAPTYTKKQIVVYSGRVYESLQGSNTNQNPATQTAYWKDRDQLSTGLTDGKRFLVTSKSFNPMTGEVAKLDLWEM